MNFRTWGAKHGIPLHAIMELENEVCGMLGTYGVVQDGHTEAYSQSQVRAEAPRFGTLMQRNNNGALKDETGRVIRFGLMNDSPALNKLIKSSDLVGIRKHVVTAADVGKTHGIYTARECKPPGWVYSGDPREEAQLAYINLINSYGGDAKFATGEGSFDD